jgi:putative Mg2+ transporter-C (MgtC) family protein
MIDLADFALRLGSATLIGGAIGLYRDLRGKPIGVRTLGLVGLASALVALGIVFGNTGNPELVNAEAREFQGVLTGIGFLGAGVIVRGRVGGTVHGLTGAACTWVTASLGLVCGLAAWPVAVIGMLMTFLVLVLGGPFESMINERFGGGTNPPPHRAVGS